MWDPRVKISCEKIPYTPLILHNMGGLYDTCKKPTSGMFEGRGPLTISKSEQEGFGRVGFREYLQGVIASTAFQ
jgi:hypothetical protein